MKCAGNAPVPHWVEAMLAGGISRSLAGNVTPPNWKEMLMGGETRPGRAEQASQQHNRATTGAPPGLGAKSAVPSSTPPGLTTSAASKGTNLSGFDFIIQKTQSSVIRHLSYAVQPSIGYSYRSKVSSCGSRGPSDKMIHSVQDLVAALSN